MFSPQQIAAVIDAARDVILAEDSTGCQDDLTVTSLSACERLKEAVEALQPRRLTVVLHHHQHGVSSLAVLVPEGTELHESEAINLLGEDYEPDREEFIDVETFKNASISTFPPLCHKCDSPVTTDGYCTDDTCAYSDWPQAVPLDDLTSMRQSDIETKHDITKRVRAPG